MSDANELLTIVRTNLSTPTALAAFDRLDAECKAGNLPDAWRIRSETAIQASERVHNVERIAELEVELAEALANNLKGMEVLATLSSGIKCLNGERDELLLHTIEVEAQRDEAMEASGE